MYTKALYSNSTDSSPAEVVPGQFLLFKWCQAGQAPIIHIFMSLAGATLAMDSDYSKQPMNIILKYMLDSSLVSYIWLMK